MAKYKVKHDLSCYRLDRDLDCRIVASDLSKISLITIFFLLSCVIVHLIAGPLGRLCVW